MSIVFVNFESIAIYVEMQKFKSKFLQGKKIEKEEALGLLWMKSYTFLDGEN